MKVKKSIIITLIGVIGMFCGCGDNNTSKKDKTGNNNNALHDKDVIKGTDSISEKDGSLMDVISDSTEIPGADDMVCPQNPTSHNPNAWKDDQICLKWKRIRPDYRCFELSQVNPNGCECGKPPYCWCRVNRGNQITPACSPDNKICCNFTSTCIPCGWHEMTQEEIKARKWDPHIPITQQKDCKEFDYITNSMHLDIEYRACYEWKKNN